MNLLEILIDDSIQKTSLKLGSVLTVDTVDGQFQQAFDTDANKTVISAHSQWVAMGKPDIVCVSNL